MSRLVASLLLSLLTLASSLAYAQAGPLPGFDAGRRVRTVPEGFVPDPIGDAGLARLETALRSLRYPFYVVLSQHLPGLGDEDRRAQDLTDGLAAAWARDGYDPAVSSVFALTFSPRKFSLLVGSRWGAELGLADAALDPYLERFLRRVRATPVDPVGGIIDMARALDAYLIDQTDPERIAARERATADKALADAIALMRQHLGADARHLPWDIDPYKQALAQAEALQGSGATAEVQSRALSLRALADQLGTEVTERRAAERAREERKQLLAHHIAEGRRLLADERHRPEAQVPAFAERLARAQATLDAADDVAITAELDAIVRDLRPLADHVAASIAAAERRSMIYGFIIIGVALVAVFALVFFLVRMGQLRRRRKAFEALAEAWDQKIENAAGRYVEFYGKRDGILGLVELEGKTKALLDQVTAEVDAIYTAVSAMEAHVKAQTELARRARWYRLRPIDQALAAVEAPFDFDTGVLNEADLFGPPTRQLRIEPSTVEADLERRFAASLDGWRRLETAAELRFHEAAALLPHSLLDAALARAEAHRIPARWLSDHPLYGDSESDRTVYEAADQHRWKDAIAFLEAIEALRARHAEVAGRLDTLVKARTDVDAARVTGLPDLSASSFDTADDPADTLEDARSAEATLDQCVLGSDLALVVTQAATTVALYRKTADQVRAIELAIASAGDAITEAGRLEVAARARLGEARDRAHAVEPLHTDTSASGDLGRADKRLNAAAVTLGRARQKLDTRRHLDAHRLALEAQQGMQAVREGAEQAIAHLDRLESVRTNYLQRASRMEQERADRLAQLRRYAPSDTLDAWMPTALSGPADYTALTVALEQQLERWNNVVRAARLAWEEAERRRREAEEAERRRRAAAAAAARSSRTSWSSSSSSRSSFGSFSSSSRSSSSSSRSGSWSSSRSSSRSGSW